MWPREQAPETYDTLLNGLSGHEPPAIIHEPDAEHIVRSLPESDADSFTILDSVRAARLTDSRVHAVPLETDLTTTLELIYRSRGPSPAALELLRSVDQA